MKGFLVRMSMSEVQLIMSLVTAYTAREEETLTVPEDEELAQDGQQ